MFEELHGTVTLLCSSMGKVWKRTIHSAAERKKSLTVLWWVACSGIQKKNPLSNAKWFQGSSFQGTSFQGSFPNLSVASPWWCVRFFHLEIWKDPSFILPWVSLKTIIKQTSDFFGLLSGQPIPSPLFILAASRPGAVNDCKGLFGAHRPWLVGGPVLDFRMVSHWFNNPIRANWGFLFLWIKATPHISKTVKEFEHR